MANQVIHGTGKPLITWRIGTGGYNLIYLPYCDSLDEYFMLDSLQKKLTNGDKKNQKRGWYYKAVLNYEKKMSKDVLESLEPLFNVALNEIWFYPRMENGNVKYRVDLPQDFELRFAQRAWHKGHKGVVLTLEGVTRLTTIDLTNDPV